MSMAMSTGERAIRARARMAAKSLPPPDGDALAEYANDLAVVVSSVFTLAARDIVLGKRANIKAAVADQRKLIEAQLPEGFFR